MSALQTPPASLDAAPHAAKGLICEATSRLCTAELAGLRTLVLTGSLARDEATFEREAGAWTLRGDAEFLAVMRDGAPRPPAPALDRLARRIEAGLGKAGLRGRLSLAAVPARYLRRLPPHIFAYELRACGQVVAGDPGALSLIPAFSAGEIPLEDGWRLLGNRILEQLEGLLDVEDRPAGDPPPDLCYRTVKLYLDMATSFLLFAGGYAPTYRRRAAALRTMAAGAGGAHPPFPLGPFADQVDACTRWKLCPGPGILDADWGFWQQARQQARALWRWELAALTGAAGPATEGYLLATWMRRQALRRRARGWLYVLRHQGWVRSWRHWLRWSRLARQASPRYLVYAAGAELFWRWPGPGAPSLRSPRLPAELSARLPIARAPAPGAAAWRRLAADAVWNYHAFVRETRA